MSVKITYLVHGTTTDNEKGLSTGQNQGKLSELGKDKSFTTIFCSDLKRAVDSAEISFRDKHPIIQDKRLGECNYGRLNGAKEEKVDYSKHIDEKFPEGESLKDVQARIESFIKFLKRNYSGKHVAIVAHKAPQLAMEVLTKNKSWKEAIETDWRKTGKWQPGWSYTVK
ncbi:histidine phosphatase family protein [Candidatus Pacearchaeota archaeon]|nr:histidine phosphatase family protein [Candidatus Pacearchaeota archaeon]